MVNVDQVARDLEDPTRIIGFDAVDGTEISTVRLPRNLWPGTHGRTVWETCLFYANGDSRVVEQYSTQEDAVAGHREWIEKVKNRLI